MMQEKKDSSRLSEVIRFVVTGGVCTLIEWGLFALLVKVFGEGVDSLIPTAIAFLISTVVNYLICYYWVFKGAKDSGDLAKLGFFVTSLIGLGLNALLMLLFRAVFGEDKILFTVFGFELKMVHVNKAFSTLLVMVWNYITKKAILQSSAMQKLADKLKSRKQNQ
ncbi:MAG: GtrA family protein [Clostridia bacterium]|nr:GtrA family protein [Clostridia bacterium]